MKATLLSLTAGLTGLISTALAGSPAAYVAHEWGTFTSVQGADGAQMVWNPFNALELPRFVYDRTKAYGPEMLLVKANTAAKQRLETPVIYFHSTESLTVDVSVRFPQGSVTEWYPRADVPKVQKPEIPAIQWKGVAITPRLSRAAQKLDAIVPKEQQGSHYYAAREAAADYVSVGKAKATEVEKLLFYRGIGNFEAPLMVTMPSSDEGRFLLLNTSTEVLSGLYLVQVRDGEMSVNAVEDIAAQSSTTTELGTPQPLAIARKALAANLREGLVRAGLYEDEAAAMVNTWDDSWFAENGTRVLYILPTAWSDRVLPLTLEPAPKEIARVFVGRAEVITPTSEVELASQVERFSTDQPSATAKVRAMGLGRFLEPTFRRLLAQRPGDENFKATGWQLMNAAITPQPPAVLSAR